MKAHSPADATAYRNMIMNVATQTAEAAKEGGFLGILFSNVQLVSAVLFIGMFFTASAATAASAASIEFSGLIQIQPSRDGCRCSSIHC